MVVCVLRRQKSGPDLVFKLKSAHRSSDARSIYIKLAVNLFQQIFYQYNLSFTLTLFILIFIVCFYMIE